MGSLENAQFGSLKTRHQNGKKGINQKEKGFEHGIEPARLNHIVNVRRYYVLKGAMTFVFKVYNISCQGLLEAM